MSSLRLVLVALLLGSCATAPSPVPAAQPDSLSRIAADYWELRLQGEPLWATYLGDRRFDAHLPDVTPAARLRQLESVKALRARLLALGPATMPAKERITAEVLEEELGATLLEEVCRSWSWSVDQLRGPQVYFAELPSFHTVSEPKHFADLLERYRGFGRYYPALMDNLKEGLRSGYVSPRINVEHVLSQLDAQLAVPPSKSPYAEVKLPSTWPEAERAQRTAELLSAIEQHIYPALRAYRSFLHSELLPKSRAKKVGVYEIPNGSQCYQNQIRISTGTARTPEALHQLGLSEVRRIGEAMVGLIRQAGHQEDLQTFMRTLKGQPDQYLASTEALLDYNRKLVSRAQAVLPQAFGALPKTRLEVREIEAFRAKESPAGYYYNAPTDGSRPAYYYVNTYEPKSRPLYNMAALAFHEGVPGHHLQIALANENERIPDFQRQLGQTAFIEGWGLYSEALAGELGLYHSLGEKLGALNYEMWRAVRLVVDTGLHAKGWTREQALAYFAEHTAHTEQEAMAEVDRYIAWPGQALAYKVGQLEILAMREEARQALGERFDLRAFHDRLLSNGAVPLATARRHLDQWVGEQVSQR